MIRFRTAVPFLALAVLFAACADTPTDARLAPDVAPLLSEAGGDFETTDLSLVVFSGQRLPNNHARIIGDHGGTIVAAYGPIGVAVVDGLTAEAAAALEALDGVFAVSPDYIFPVELPEGIAVDEAVLGEVANNNPETAFFFARQWHLQAIDAPAAWAAGFTGSSAVTVAILDTGLGYLHADLVGLVDLSRSASFVPSDDALVQAFFPGAHPVADLHWHGTHVGATVASNALAAAGVTSKTTLIGVKVCNVNGSCPTSGVLAGLMYAADQGADIANLSLGGLFLKSLNPGFVAVINRAYTYANRQGMAVVTSAGNANTDLDRNIHPTAGHVPSLYASYCDAPNAVCVSATGPLTAGSVNGPWTELDTRAGYSNFGRSAIDVAAPGGRGGLTGNGGLVWAACSSFSLQVPICQTGTFIIGSTGTSMASPHAAGVAALIAANGARNPAQIRNRLHQTADDIGDPGTDPFFGKGRVNAARAAGVN
jgi:lantibiotic leader peptide-processing serine protease